MWVAENIQNAQLLRLNSVGDSLISSKYLKEENGFKPKLKVRIFDFEDRLVISNNSTFFTYDYLSESVKPYEWLNEQLGKYEESSFLLNTAINEYWLLNTRQFGKFLYDGEKLNLSRELFHETIHYSIESDRQNIFKIDGNNYIIGHDNGFMVNTLLQDTVRDEKWQSKLKLVAATCFNERGQITNLGIQNTNEFKIPFQYRNLSFTYAVPGNFPKIHKLYYRLDNNDWMENSTSTTLTFNYLPWGSHKLRAKVLDEKENVISEIIHTVKVLPPWYLTAYAMGAYLLLVLGIVYAIAFFNRYRLKKQKLAYLKKIKRDNTRRIIQMKNQYLKTEVQNKSAQLVNYTVILGKKNEVLIKIKDLLDNSSFAEKNAGKISKIYEFINQNLSDKNEWKIFSAHFDEAHSNFLRKLKKEHELLTPNDLQLCAFLKMNLSSKEIAALLNISPRSVEVKRYRLRKKLDLAHDDNLVEYLLEI